MGNLPPETWVLTILYIIKASLQAPHRLVRFTVWAALLHIYIYHCNNCAYKDLQLIWSRKYPWHFDTMRKFFDSRRELVSSGPGSGGGGSSSGSSHAGGNFIGRAFTVGRHQVTVEEIIAEGKNGLHRSDNSVCLFARSLSPSMHVTVWYMSCMPSAWVA